MTATRKRRRPFVPLPAATLDERVALMEVHGVRLGERDLFEPKSSKLKSPEHAAGGKGLSRTGYSAVFRARCVKAGKKALKGVRRGGKVAAIAAAAEALGVNRYTLTHWLKRSESGGRA